jgi:hypothetical protein
MKIVVFGPERRAGALVDERVIDLNYGLAKYLSERGETNGRNKRLHGYRPGCYRLSNGAPPDWQTRKR